MENNKILITGANGQLGSEFKRITDKFPQFTFVFANRDNLDITDKNQCISLLKNEKITYTVNCAAYTAVDKAEEEKEQAHLINSEAVQNLTEACKETDSYLIHISTDYVFDGTNYCPYKEDDKINPQSEYGLSKAQGEKHALKYSKAMVIRTSWLYSSFGSNFVKTMIKLAKEREQLNVVFDQIGTPTLAEDLATAIMLIISDIDKNQEKFQSGAFHYSNEGICSWYDFAHAIIKFKNISCAINPIESKDFPTLAKRPHYSVLNKSKIKTSYNITIPHWYDSLKKLLINM